MRATVVLSSVVLTSLLACPAPLGAQVDHSLHGAGGLKWVVADAVGYGGLGFGLGVLVARAVEGSGGGPVHPTAAAHFPGGTFTSHPGLGNFDHLVYAPDVTTLAIVTAATMAGAVAGTMIGLDARRITTAGGHVEGIRRAAVLGGGVLAGGTLGALAAVPLVGRKRSDRARTGEVVKVMTAYPGAVRVAVPLLRATPGYRFLILAGIGAVALTPATSLGQAPSSGDLAAGIVLPAGPIEWSPRRFNFHDEGGRRSPVGAAILGAYVPLAGYAYAGRWKRGIAPQALWLTFAGGMAYASDCDVDGGCSSTQETVGAVAWTAGVASVFWGGVGAYRTARAHNRAVEERPQIEARPGGDGSVSVGLRVPFR